MYVRIDSDSDSQLVECEYLTHLTTLTPPRVSGNTDVDLVRRLDTGELVVARWGGDARCDYYSYGEDPASYCMAWPYLAKA